MPVWINGTTYKIDVFFLNLLAVYKFKKVYSECESDTKTYLRTLLSDGKTGAGEIERIIIFHVLPKKYKTLIGS